MIMMIITTPVSIHLLDLFILNYSQYFSVKVLIKLHIKGIKPPTYQLCTQRFYCPLSFIVGSLICSNRVILKVFKTR